METSGDSTANRSFIDHRGAPYLVLLAWLVVLGVTFGIGLEYVDGIEADPDCSWDSCIQPFVGPMLWLLAGGVVVGLGTLGTAALVGLLEFSGPSAQRARFWLAAVGPGSAVIGYLAMTALVILD